MSKINVVIRKQEVLNLSTVHMHGFACLLVYLFSGEPGDPGATTATNACMYVCSCYFSMVISRSSTIRAEENTQCLNATLNKI